MHHATKSIFVLPFLKFVSPKENFISGLENPNYVNDLNDITPKIGHFSKLRFTKIDLTNFSDLDLYCNASVQISDETLFTDCWDRLSGIKIMKSGMLEDTKPWVMQQNVPFFETNSSKSRHDSFNALLDNRGGIPELSIPYAPHLMAISGAYVGKWGYIFDHNKLYNYGGCGNKGWDEPTLEIDLWKYKVRTFNEPILSLIHPYSKAHFHEMLETYATIFMTKTLLSYMPNIPILVKMNSRNLVADEFSIQLLNALGINSTTLNIVPLGPQDVTFVTKFLIRNFFKENNAVAHAPYIITPLSLYCQYVSRGTLQRMRHQLAQSLSSIWSSQVVGGSHPDSSLEERIILLYFDADAWRLKFEEARSDSKQRNDARQHGVNPRRKRRAFPASQSVESQQLFKALQRRYDSPLHHRTLQSVKWKVKVYYGNETFEETVQTFRSTSVFIATHGRAMSNILFMQENSSVIELRPIEWPVSMYMDVCNSLEIKYFDVRTANGVDVMDAAGKSGVFMDQLFEVIDAH